MWNVQFNDHVAMSKLPNLTDEQKTLARLICECGKARSNTFQYHRAAVNNFNEPIVYYGDWIYTVGRR
jgi:hypothetical protein